MAFDKRLRQIWRSARSSAHSRGKFGLEHLVDDDAAIGGAQLEQMVAILDDADQRNRFLIELVAAGLDARQIENLVDQAEQMHAGIMDIGGIFLVSRHRVLAEDFRLHHFGEAEDGVERRAQFVAHLREEARLRDVGGFRALARLVGD